MQVQLSGDDVRAAEQYVQHGREARRELPIYHFQFLLCALTAASERRARAGDASAVGVPIVLLSNDRA